MTIFELTEKEYSGAIDIDVCDTDVDIMVAFVYSTDISSDPYDQFLDLLAKHVKVVTKKPNMLVCDFSGYYKNYNDKIYDWYINTKHQTVDNKDEAYCDLVELTESLVAGYCSDNTYVELLNILR